MCTAAPFLATPSMKSAHANMSNFTAQTDGTRALVARAHLARALARLFAEPLTTASQADKNGGEEAMRGRAAEGWWGGGGPSSLPSHAPLTPRLALPVQTSPQGPPTPACATPEQPSPIAAPVRPSTPPTSCVPPAPVYLAQGEPPATGPTTPPPWPEAYIFSMDPDRIMCRKCCKRHYNFHWYSHCFMCNRSDNAN